MEKTILKITALAREIADSKDSERASENIDYIKIWLARFQHERLIHLIVTVAFSLIAMGCVLYINVCFSIPLGILTLIFVIMSIAYIRHYYILENNVQKLYFLIDELEGLVKGKNGSE